MRYVCPNCGEVINGGKSLTLMQIVKMHVCDPDVKKKFEESKKTPIDLKKDPGEPLKEKSNFIEDSKKKPFEKGYKK